MIGIPCVSSTGFITGILATVIVVMCLASCAVRPKGGFDLATKPLAPDYSDTAHWAALPWMRDSADVVPEPWMRDKQSEARADVFYIHPTTYTGRKGQNHWNAGISDKEFNEYTDRTAIRNQATIFNVACRVFAPRYRQAHLRCFFVKQRKDDAALALELAYRDVRTAFLHYLEHFNEGRPLIIAAHSQGTLHAARILREFFDDKQEVQVPLIAAYLVGMPVDSAYFKRLEPCSTATDTDCYCSWRTVDEKFKPGRAYPSGEHIVVTNPLTWSVLRPFATREEHLGAVFRRFYNGIYPEWIDARVDNGFLRTSRLKVPGMPVMPLRNYHIGDYNLFYADIRANVKERVAAFTGHAGK